MRSLLLAFVLAACAEIARTPTPEAPCQLGDTARCVGPRGEARGTAKCVEGVDGGPGRFSCDEGDSGTVVVRD